MNLVLDIGNTNKKIALFGEDGTIRTFIQHPEISLKILQKFDLDHPGIESCILSSVTETPEPVKTFLKDHYRFIELTEKTPVPILNRYTSPETLGKDRLAAAVGGALIFPRQDILVIVAGTCITYNLVTSENEFLGGAISPGMNMRFQSLHTFTGKLPLVSFKEFPEIPGSDTEQSILSGVIHGIACEIEGFTGLYKEKHPDLRIILSGGDLHYFDKRLKISIFAFPNLVLHGLHQILLFNVENAK